MRSSNGYQTAIEAFSALADADRLAVYRAVSQAGHEGISLGALGQDVGFASVRLSTALQWLKRASLVTILGVGPTASIRVNDRTLRCLLKALQSRSCTTRRGDNHEHCR